MILNIFSISFLLCAVWVGDVWGAPYSNVFVQRNSDYTPVEYIQYRSPSVAIEGAQIAQLSAPSVRSVVPVPNYVSPCGVSPCLVSGQNIAPIPSTANLITYNSPISSVPVVVPREESTGYQYSYVVYDDLTGDQKAQREHSDGSVVRGEYSLIQPDGYVREVQYVADDTNGFNVIVKNFLPASVGENKKIEHKKEIQPVPPCNEVKNEHLEKEETHDVFEHQKHEPLIEAHNLKQGRHYNDIKEGQSHSTENNIHSEGVHHSEESKHGHTTELNGHSEVIHHTKAPEDDTKEKEHDSLPESHSEHTEAHKIQSEVIEHDYPEHQTSETANHVAEEHTEDHKEHKKESSISSESSESDSNESHEGHLDHNLAKTRGSKSSGSSESSDSSNSSESKETEGEKSQDSPNKHVEKHQEELANHAAEHHENEHHSETHEVETHPAEPQNDEIHNEKLKLHDNVELLESDEHHNKSHEAHQEHIEVERDGDNSGVKYSNIIRCVNRAMNSAPSSHKTEPSPLTYIILNKPC